MTKTPAVLIDDPEANDQYDLRRVLSGWRHGLLAVVSPAEPSEAAAPEAAAGPAAPERPDAASKDAASKSDSLTTRTLKGATRHFRLEGKSIPPRTFAAAEGPEVLRGLGAAPLLFVCFISYATCPLVVALAHHEWSRGMLRVGVTGVRMDTGYNVARKLIVDGEIAYHEHTRALEKLLCPRLELMLQAHEERAGGAARSR
jgi:hypothetical protein